MNQMRNILNSPERIRRRRRKQIIKISVLAGCVLFILGALSWLTYYKEFTVTNVEVAGNDVINPDNLRSIVQDELKGGYLMLFAKRNAFLLPRRSIKKHILDEYKRIEKLDIDLVGLHTVKINITERKPYVLWCGENYSIDAEDISVIDDCYFVDRGGFVFDRAPNFSVNVYFTVYSLLAPALSNAQDDPIGREVGTAISFTHLMEFREALQKDGIKSTRLIALPDNDYELGLTGGGLVLFNGGNSLAETLNDLFLAIETKLKEREDLFGNLEYIDARFIDNRKVYFKFYN